MKDYIKMACRICFDWYGLGPDWEKVRDGMLTLLLCVGGIFARFLLIALLPISVPLFVWVERKCEKQEMEQRRKLREGIHRVGGTEL